MTKIEYKKKWYLENKERIKEKSREHYLKNKDKISFRRKQRYELNKQQELEKQKLYYQNNKDVIKEYQKIYNQKNKDKLKKKRKSRHLRDTYAISIEDFNLLLKQQNESCAICNKHQNELKQTLCIDHNHKTGKVRGLLCSTCNSGIGFLQENSIIINNVLDYLKKYHE